MKLNLNKVPGKTTGSIPGVADFISELFTSNTQAKIYHLQTQSFAQHKALNEFYEEIEDLTDSLVEAYQGEYDFIKGYTSKSLSEDDKPVNYLTTLRQYVQTNRYKAFSKEDTHLQNIIDEITALIDSTLYKLKKLS